MVGGGYKQHLESSHCPLLSAATVRCSLPMRELTLMLSLHSSHFVLTSFLTLQRPCTPSVHDWTWPQLCHIAHITNHYQHTAELFHFATLLSSHSYTCQHSHKSYAPYRTIHCCCQSNGLQVPNLEVVCQSVYHLDRQWQWEGKGEGEGRGREGR